MNNEVMRKLDNFWVRYFNWSLAETQRELREGFPLLKKIKSASALGYIDYLESLPKEQQRRLAMALVKRGYKHIIELTNDEKIIVDRFLSEYINYFGKYLNEYNLKCFTIYI